MNPSATTLEKMTIQEFYAMTDAADDRYELIDGEPVRMPSPNPNHQDIVLNVAVMLRLLKLAGKISVAPIDVELDEGSVVQPDVMWVAPDGSCHIGEKRLYGAPALVVEVSSPGTARLDRRDKFELYQRVGVREYWMVDSVEQYLEAYTLEEGRYRRLGVFVVGDTFLSPVLNHAAPDLSAVFPTSNAAVVTTPEETIA